MANNHRTPRPNHVDILVTVDINNPRALALNEISWYSTDRGKCAHWRTHSTWDYFQCSIMPALRLLRRFHTKLFFNSSAASNAQYVQMTEAPARLTEESTSKIARSRSMQPWAAANSSMAISPETI